MATSGTATWNPDFTEIAELAWRQAGRVMESGMDFRMAQMCMNLLTIEFQNRGLNLFTYEEGVENLVQGQGEYLLPADTIDLLDSAIRTGMGSPVTQSDLTITRISMPTYLAIPNKLTQGRPIQIFVDRSVAQPKVHVWPVPDQGTQLQPYYQLVYWRMRRIEDIGNGPNTADTNFRFYPVIIAGLAKQLALKTPELAARVPQLEQEFEAQWTLAAGEDRDRSSLMITPYRGYQYRR